VREEVLKAFLIKFNQFIAESEGKTTTGSRQPKCGNVPNAEKRVCHFLDGAHSGSINLKSDENRYMFTKKHHMINSCEEKGEGWGRVVLLPACVLIFRLLRQLDNDSTMTQIKL
jgi:hypothetical protein